MESEIKLALYLLIIIKINAQLISYYIIAALKKKALTTGISKLFSNSKGNNFCKTQSTGTNNITKSKFLPNIVVEKRCRNYDFQANFC